MGKLFEKSFPKPLQKLFGWDGTGFRSCNSGASNGSNPISEKIARDLVTSAQRDVLLELFVIFIYFYLIEVF
ncbi:MAG: hypothetical protein IJW81_10365 [Clostridia bacterium]|nr:hypothetical protein [Clostridia bacterium]